MHVYMVNLNRRDLTMNYHQELLKLIPNFYKDSDMIEKMFNEMMVSSPKAVINAYKEVAGIDKETPISVLQKIIVDFTGTLYSYEALEPIIDCYKTGKRIAAIKEIRTLTNASLKEVKDCIHNVFVDHSIYDELMEK